jgi:hypothetical protein
MELSLGCEKTVRRNMGLRMSACGDVTAPKGELRRVACFTIVSAVVLVGLVTAGCADLTGGGSASGQQEAKPSRDIDEHVDAAVKDFRNE